MQTYEELKKNARKMVSLTNLTPEVFEYLLPAFEKVYQQVFPDTRTKIGQTRERKSGGGRKGALASIEQKLLFALVYQKSYPVQSEASLGYEPERDPKKFKKSEQGVPKGDGRDQNRRKNRIYITAARRKFIVIRMS